MDRFVNYYGTYDTYVALKCILAKHLLILLILFIYLNDKNHIIL